MSYLVTRDAIESSGPGEALARPSLDWKQGHWAALGMGTLCTLCPALCSLLSVLCTLICSRICDCVGVLLSCGLRRLKRGTQMHQIWRSCWLWGPFWVCVGGCGGVGRPGTGEMCLEQGKSRRTGLRGWEISSLVRKKFFVLGKTEASSGFDRLPSGGPRPLS